MLLERRADAVAAGDRAGHHRRAPRRAPGAGEGAAPGRSGDRAGSSGSERSAASAGRSRSGCTRSSARSSCGASAGAPSPARTSTSSATRSFATSPTSRSRAAARADKHRAAAEWIESLGRPEDHAEMLAHHYAAALEAARASGQDDASRSPSEVGSPFARQATAPFAPQRVPGGSALLRARPRALAARRSRAARAAVSGSPARTTSAATSGGSSSLEAARDGVARERSRVEHAAEADALLAEVWWYRKRPRALRPSPRSRGGTGRRSFRIVACEGARPQPGRALPDAGRRRSRRRSGSGRRRSPWPRPRARRAPSPTR